jgi:hypothetical protein
MAITREIEEAIKAFNDIILGGVPFLLRQNETALLSFMCNVAAIDALAGYRYPPGHDANRFARFVRAYFPATYAQHADNLYLLRCRLLHNFCPAFFTVTHGNPGLHLSPSAIGDFFLNDELFFQDLKNAALRFFGEVRNDPSRQDAMNVRLFNLDRGGAIAT